LACGSTYSAFFMDLPPSPSLSPIHLCDCESVDCVVACDGLCCITEYHKIFIVATLIPKMFLSSSSLCTALICNRLNMADKEA